MNKNTSESWNPLENWVKRQSQQWDNKKSGIIGKKDELDKWMKKEKRKRKLKIYYCLFNLFVIWPLTIYLTVKFFSWKLALVLFMWQLAHNFEKHINK